MALSSSSIILAASVLLLLNARRFANGKRYDLTPGWVFTNNGTLEKSSGSSYRALQTEKSEQISSGNFTLAFYDPENTGKFFLSVLLIPGVSKPASLAVPIWVANSNSSVSEGATLMFTRNHRKMILLDGGSDASLRWNSGVTDIKGIELTEAGNLRLYSDDDTILWQSFQHPTNVLVPEQTLSTGMSLSSIDLAKNGSRQSEFGFVGAVESSGFVLYVVPESKITMANILRKPQPYQVWDVFGSFSLESATRVCDSSTAAVLKFTSMGGISVSYEKKSSSCPLAGETMVFSDSQGGGGDRLRYLKLEDGGDLLVYEFDAGVESWSEAFRLSGVSNSSCKLPTECGSYGFCNKDRKCSCVVNPENDSEAESEDLRFGNSCSPPAGVSAACLVNEAENHHFFRVEKASYFSNHLMKPDKEKISESDCVGLCSSNCSCAAAFFRSESGSCFLVDELTGSMSVEASEPDSTGFVKFQNSKLKLDPLTSRSGDRL